MFCILYCNSTLGSKAANIIPINSCLDTHKLSFNFQRENEVIWSITFPGCRSCTWFFWARGGPPPCVLQSSRLAATRVSIGFSMLGAGSQSRPASWLENTKPNPPNTASNTHFIYSYSFPQKKKKKEEKIACLIPIQTQCWFTFMFCIYWRALHTMGALI